MLLEGSSFLSSQCALVGRAVRLSNDLELKRLNLLRGVELRDIYDEEAMTLYLLASILVPSGGRIAEVNADLGDVSSLLSQATKDTPDITIEVYGAFERNDLSVRSLDVIKNQYYYYDLWQSNVKKYRDRLVVKRGVVDATVRGGGEELDLVFVPRITSLATGISLINYLYSRIKVGGILILRNYFFWDSPLTSVHAEATRPFFKKVGDVGFNTCVLVKTGEGEAAPSVAKWGYPEIYEALDKAASDYSGARRGLLELQKLRVSIDDPSFDSITYEEYIRDTYVGAARVLRHLNSFRAWALKRTHV